MLAERARLLRRLARYADAEAAWRQLTATRGTVGALAWIEVAKLREHRLGDFPGAIEAAAAALRLVERQAWLGRPLPGLETALGARLARLGARAARRRAPARSGTPSRPGPSTVSDAAAAANVAGSSRPPTKEGWRRVASIAARKTSPAPVASTTASDGMAS